MTKTSNDIHVRFVVHGLSDDLAIARDHPVQLAPHDSRSFNIIFCNNANQQC
jgi:hypothetical protein